MGQNTGYYYIQNVAPWAAPLPLRGVKWQAPRWIGDNVNRMELPETQGEVRVGWLQHGQRRPGRSHATRDLANK
jgi:hypothetical protein